MSNRLPSPPLLVITDRQLAVGDMVDIAAAVFAGGCRWMMVRDHHPDADALAALATRIIEKARPAGARIIVNGDIDTAVMCGADGVHLQSLDAIAGARATLGPDALVGYSAHSGAEAVAAGDYGADYVLLSPVFETPSKPGYGPPLGVDQLGRACRDATVPILALAGVTPSRVARCMAAGAAGIAVMGSVMGAADPAETTGSFIAAIVS